MAEEQDPESKTEDPTPKRLQEARKRGQVAQSRELGNFLLLLAAALILSGMLPHTVAGLMEAMKNFLSRPEALPADPGGLGQILREAVWAAVKVIAAPVLIMMLVGIMSGPVQFGFLLTPESIIPKFNKISPMAGLKRLFSRKSLVEFLKNLLKITVVGYAAYVVIRPVVDDLDVYPIVDLAYIPQMVHHYIVRIFTAAVIIIGVLAIVDFLYQRHEFMKQMRMTRQEVRDEFKQSEGDPHIKQRLRKLRMERARKRMMKNVPLADVVITNPTHYAVALQYNPNEMEAPQLVAKGTDLIALRIRDIAQEHEVPIVENPPLARTLFAAYDLEQYIQPEHYQAVAEIISYVFQLKKKRIS